MKIGVSVEQAGVQRMLQRLGQRARDLSPVLREIGSSVVDEARLGFKASTDPYGQPWKPLKAATIARRRKGSAKPLLDTGRLRNSIAWQQAGPAAVDIGTSLAYAAIHQFGGQAGRKRKTTIPARPYIATKERGLPRAYGEIIRDALARHFRGVGA